MKIYPVPMIPGPVSVPASVLEAYRVNYGSADLEKEFLELHGRTQGNLQKILGTENAIVIQPGEGMLALWSALKCCLRPGDRVSLGFILDRLDPTWAQKSRPRH